MIAPLTSSIMTFFQNAAQALRILALSSRKPRGRVVVFCGAGLSAASGLSVYRGDSGVWTLSPEAMAAMDMRHWPESREAALGHLAQWRRQALGCEPNDAHFALAAWKKAWPKHVDIITQNVDGLLQRAGLRDEDVLEIHGSLHRMSCLSCMRQWALAPDDDNGQPCPFCHSPQTKPSVVFFHQGAPLYGRMLELCQPETRMPADTFLAIGTSWKVISPDMLMATRGRVFGQQISVDARPQPELDSWMHAQFEGGAILGVAWAQAKIFEQWRLG
jgi:NAD-dependent deacetylase